MSGYKIRLILYCNTETWREVEVPTDITFRQLDYVIKKVFGFIDIIHPNSMCLKKSPKMMPLI